MVGDREGGVGEYLTKLTSMGVRTRPEEDCIGGRERESKIRLQGDLCGKDNGARICKRVKKVKKLGFQPSASSVE